MRTTVRRRVSAGAVLRSAPIVATLVCGAAAVSATAMSSLAPVSIYATMGNGRGPDLIEVGGTQVAPQLDRYVITGYLRGVPCPDRTYQFALSASLGTARVTYRATVTLHRLHGKRLRCAVPLARGLGLDSVSLVIYRDQQPEISIVGRRSSKIAIVGTLTTSVEVCPDPALRMQTQFSSPSGRPHKTVYALKLTNVSVNGKPACG